VSKILAQAGTSLADTYDIEGSIAGVENLESKDVHLFDEMGGRVHSERLLQFGLIADSTAVLQTVAWDIELGGFPDSINRLLSISVIATAVARTDFCSVAIRDSESLIDHVIWAWDAAVDVEKQVRWARPTVGNQVLLEPANPILGGAPTIIARTGASSTMPSLFFRGQSLTFGAGTIQVKALINIARPDPGAPPPGAPSSHGLPIPGW